VSRFRGAGDRSAGTFGAWGYDPRLCFRCSTI